MTSETRSPSSESGSWHDPTNAYTDDLNYAYCGDGEGGLQHVYSGYGFSSVGVINEVRVDVKGYSGDGTKHTVTVEVYDGAWQTVGEITSESECNAHQFDASTYIDTPEKLNAIQVRITANGLSAGSPGARYVRVCWIPVYADWTPAQTKYDDRDLVLDVEQGVFSDRSLVLDARIRVFSDRDLVLDVERSSSSDRNLVLDIEYPPLFSSRSLILDVEQQVYADRDLLLDVEKVSFTDRDLLLDVEKHGYVDRDLLLDVERQGYSTRSLILDVEYPPLLSDRSLILDVELPAYVAYSSRDLLLDVEKELAVDRPLTLDVERTIFIDRDLILDVEHQALSDRSLILNVELPYLEVLSDRSIVLDVEKFVFRLTTEAVLLLDGGSVTSHHGPLAKTLYALSGDPRLLRHLDPGDSWQGDLAETTSKWNTPAVSGILYKTFKLLSEAVNEGHPEEIPSILESKNTAINDMLEVLCDPSYRVTLTIEQVSP